MVSPSAMNDVSGETIAAGVAAFIRRTAGEAVRPAAMWQERRRRTGGAAQSVLRYFRNSPLTPPEMSDVTLARMRGSASPAGVARYRGSQRGSNFSL